MKDRASCNETKASAELVDTGPSLATGSTKQDMGRWESEGGSPPHAGAATASFEGSIAHAPSSLDRSEQKR